MTQHELTEVAHEDAEAVAAVRRQSRRCEYRSDHRGRGDEVRSAWLAAPLHLVVQHSAFAICELVLCPARISKLSRCKCGPTAMVSRHRLPGRARSRSSHSTY